VCGFDATADKMRKALTITLALGWAACYLVQAMAMPDHPVLGFDGAGQLAAAIAALLHVVVAGLFLWLLACMVSSPSAGFLMPFADWLRLTFTSAGGLVLLGAIVALPVAHTGLLGVAFFQLAALLASYIVAVREPRGSDPLHAANDNTPLGLRIAAWNAARDALYDDLPRRIASPQGKRR
jgi:hypothetical protein